MGWQNFSDEELLNLLKAGDRRAYTEIFSRYNRLLVAHAYRLLGNRDTARDVVQDIFMVLWAKHDILHITGSFSAYLYKATRNRILDRIAHQEIVNRYLDSAIHFLNKTSTLPDEIVIEKELIALVEKEIKLLPENARIAFILRKQQELSYDAIAQQLGISEAAAKQQVYNAVKALRLKVPHILTMMLF